MKAYKGFNADMTCRGFKYEEGKVYYEAEASLCEKGFHACVNPIDCFTYYPPSSSIYHEVEIDEVDTSRDIDSKICGKKIKIGTRLTLAQIIKLSVDFILSKTDRNAGITNTGNQSAATNTGDKSAATNTGNQSAATNTGNWSAATNTGNRSAATNTGNQSAATNTGNQSAATNTGNRSAATNTGYRSAATNTGNQSAATNTGNQSAATNTGDWSAAEVSGKESIAMVTGLESKARGSLGCWIVLTERGKHDGETFPIKTVRAYKVDGKKVLADTWYTLKNGRLTKVE